MKISPSVLACNFGRMADEITAMERAGVEMIHLDVMDGHFVPNISFGVPVIASLRPQSKLIFDVHLMISDPLFYTEAFVKAGADLITFHVESDSDVQQTIDAIRSYGKKVGLSVKPKTPAAAILPYLDQLDMVLVMTVEPGFGGQKFMGDMMPKLAELRDACRARGLDIDLQVDGGVDVGTAPIVAESGANVLVAGSALFSKPDYTAAVKELREAALRTYQK